MQLFVMEKELLNVATCKILADLTHTPCTNHREWTNLGIYGHIIDADPALALIFITQVNVKGVYPIQPYTIPPTPKELITPQVNVTLNDTLADIGFPKVWADLGFDGGSGSDVSVVYGSCDTGIDETHSGIEYPFKDGPADLIPPTPATNRILGKADFSGGPPYHPHGTWTSEIAARSPRSDGTWKGAAYRAKIFYAQVLDANGSGTTTTVVDGLNYLAGQNVDVINMSLGGPYDPVMNQALETIWSQGILVCAACGNSGTYPPPCDGSIMSPASANDAIACGAESIKLQDPNGQGQRYVQTWTDRGPRKDGSKVPYYTVAPGVTMQPGFDDPVNSGTSFSTPHHSGLVLALVHKMKRLNPTMTKLEIAVAVRAAIEAGGLPLGYEKNYPADQAYCIQGNGAIQADVTYANIGGTPPPANNTAQHVYTAAGVYTAIVNVTDAAGNKGTAQIQITVTQPVIPGLQVSLSSDTQKGVAPLTVNFAAAVTGGTGPYAYSWVFGD